MSPRELLESLRARHIRVWSDGDRINWRGPKGAMTSELAASAREHKGALLGILRSPEFQAAEASWRLSSEGPGWVAIRSGTLDGEIVVFRRDSSVALPPAIRQAVVYDRAELEGIVAGDVSPADLLKLHRAKQLFRGSLESRRVQA